MSDGIIERMAKALCQHGEPDCWRTHIDDARRAFKCVRDIPKEMLDAYDDVACSDDGPPARFSVGAWEAAVDVALKPAGSAAPP